MPALRKDHIFTSESAEPPVHPVCTLCLRKGIRSVSSLDLDLILKAAIFEFEIFMASFPTPFVGSASSARSNMRDVIESCE
jgi:hypothetical protein